MLKKILSDLNANVGTLHDKELGKALLSAKGAYLGISGVDSTITELAEAVTALEKHDKTLSLIEVMVSKTEVLASNLANVSIALDAIKARTTFLESEGGNDSIPESRWFQLVIWK